MVSERKTDEYWKKHLSKELYSILREGKNEDPNTGEYLYTNKVGMYHCRGCGAPVFDSIAKINDGSGYATFKISAEDTALVFTRSYTSPEGDLVRVICAQCDSKLGFVDVDELKSVSDLEQGRAVQLVHVNSGAVVFKKHFTVANYPYAFFSIFIIIFIGITFAWSWSKFFSSQDSGSEERVAEEVVVRVGGKEISSEVIRVVDQEEILVQEVVSPRIIIFSSVQDVRLRFSISNQHSDVVWLNDAMRVLEYERVWSSEEHILTAPSTATYVLIAGQNVLSQEIFQKGYLVNIQGAL